MKLSEISNEERNIKLLVYGESGTGKTCFGCGFPGPVYVADFDGKISSAGNYYGDNPERMEAISFDRYLPGGTYSDGKAVIDAFNAKLEEIISAEAPPKTFVLDSLTMFSEQLMAWVIAGNPGIKGVVMGDGKTIPAMQHYRVLNIKFKEFITKVLSLPCHVVVTAHMDAEKDELTGRIEHGPLLSGKLKKILPILFEEVYRSFVRDKKYWAQTQTDSQFNCRTQTKGIPSPMILDFKEIEKCL